jgi:hypothetical protein
MSFAPTPISDTLPPSLDTPEFLLRLTRTYQAGDWVGAFRKVFGPLVEWSDQHSELENHPPHYLAALWRPTSLRTPFLPRWPFKLTLVQPDPVAAVRDMLLEIPVTQRLWLARRQVDWALMAEIAMVGETELVPFQYRGLQAFVQAERHKTLAEISLHYGGSNAVFEDFADTQSQWATGR